jgi:hypothetical protein
VSSLARGLVDKFPGAGAWDRDLNGACAELAFAKWVGVYWGAGVDTFHVPDVGELHVRHTVRSDGSLVLRRHDADEPLYVLLTGEVPTFVIRGAMRGRDGKRSEWLRDPGDVFPAYFVPQSELVSVGDALRFLE